MYILTQKLSYLNSATYFTKIRRYRYRTCFGGQVVGLAGTCGLTLEILMIAGKQM